MFLGMKVLDFGTGTESIGNESQEDLVMGNLANRYGLDAVTKNLHDPFEDGPKAFNKVVVRSMTQPEKEPEHLERPAEVPAKLTVIERPASPPPPSPKKMGRPKSDGPKPWDVAGLSKSEYYRKKSKGEV